MNEQNTVCTVADTTANPAPLGLLGFGMTTIMLNLHNAGYFPLDSMILGMGIFIGGIAQVIAGAMEWKKKNTFGTTAFTLYGFFWLSLVALLVLPKLGLGEASSPLAMGCYLSVWGLFTACMFIGTLKLNRALQVVFLSLTVLFFMLAYADFTGGSKTAAGFEGLFCGFSAFYAAIAQILNEVYGRKVLPL
jgi:succinate-acetate transporter protein